MDKSDFSDIERELRYQEFMIRYLQEEQKKRWEELHEIERKMSELDIIRENLEQLKNDPRFKKLVELAEKEKHKTSRSAEQVRVRRRCTKRAERGGDPPSTEQER
ncbi:hypothetical protein [Methanoregula sp.]|uniref:hypothetical protein n=1 Tax=Methanoregula sp. TaxID=2052170 RepID=UPI003BAFE051